MHLRLAHDHTPQGAKKIAASRKPHSAISKVIRPRFLLRGHCIAIVMTAGLAIGIASPAFAQATPAEKAREIVTGFGKRSSLPPVDSQARLDAADAPTCAAIGEQLAHMRPEVAARLCSFIGRSNNKFAHAALLVAMESGDEEIRAMCLNMLVTLKFSEVLALGEAAKQLQPTIFERLREDGKWTQAIAAKVRALCSQDERSRESPVAYHQQACLALIVDLYGGGKGFETLVSELLVHMVGEGPASDVPPESEDGKEAAVPEGDAPAAEVDDGLSNQERERIRLIQERRFGAVAMFRRLMVIDPDGFFQLGKSANYERRVERAAQFWDRLGGVEVPTGTPEEKRAESSRLIRNDYVQEHGPVRSWRAMLQWVQRSAPTRDEQILALIIMDELCEGVQIEGEKPTPKPGDDTPPEELETPMIPAITGETMRFKVEEFMKLDLRTGQRPRIRAIRRVFEEKFMKD